MDRETFGECFDVALDYYGKTLTEAEWDFYYAELGKMTVPQLDKAIRDHMASLKSFPLTSHLRPERKKQILDRRRPVDPRKHPEFNRTYLACLNIFHARVEGQPFAGTDAGTSYPIDINKVVGQAQRYFQAMLEQGELTEHTIKSQCASGMYQRLIQEFEALPGRSNEDADTDQEPRGEDPDW